MKKLLFILVILFSSCWQSDYDEYNIKNHTRADEYYWYYNDSIFHNVDSCQVIGILSSLYDKDFYNINRRYKVYHDTIYIEKRRIAGHHKYFDGIIYTINYHENEYRITVELQ